MPTKKVNKNFMLISEQNPGITKQSLRDTDPHRILKKMYRLSTNEINRSSKFEKIKKCIESNNPFNNQK